MRVIHTAAELKNPASGPSQTIPRLLYHLHRGGTDVFLHALVPEPELQLDFPQHYHPKLPMPGNLGISPSMRHALRRDALAADIIQCHNLWQMPNVYPYAAARLGKCRLVVTPRGTLTRWSLRYRRRRKQLFWWALQRRVVAGADLVHATSAEERDDLRTLGIRGPIAVIPNGVDLPPPREPSPSAGLRRLLFLGRIHPKKGVDVLLHAWSRVEGRHADWELRLVGPDNEGYKEKMLRLAAQLKLRRCTFDDPLFGDAKIAAYQSASLFVLPTHSENFGVSVAEALASGLPAVVSKGAPWQGLEEERCGRWIDHGVDALTSALDEMMGASEEQRRAAGARGRAWIERDFSWSSIADRTRATYEWLLGAGPTPSWVSR